MKGALAAAFLALAVPSVHAVDKTRFPQLVAQLKAAATNLDRMALLSTNADWFFDFNIQPYSTFSPGGVVNANAATFPATVGAGMTMAMLNLGPCSMLPPHLHPRATNFVVAVHGTTQTYMINENGAPTISQVLQPGQMTIFPQGAVHSMYNMGCNNAQLVSALNSEDPGTSNLINGLFNIPNADLVNAAMGYQNIDTNATASGIPAVGTGSIYGIASCLKKCNAQNKGQAPSDAYGAKVSPFNYAAGGN
ncbi:RmlC-like cupin [Myriangium duriaei CBS 260.36]|uniref:RmlC-like cupin n=1 Tax=Myriangium duriaei CBS 260.36 TaxID=1168546 RepID=A0A9P4J6F6_9PEZI|nr:RmlC-like cupin [Myriangium duriaei CBS 260.36]